MTINRIASGKIATVNTQHTTAPERCLYFGPFALYTQQHLLLKNGETVQLGSRALLLLIALVTRAGELLKKNELLSLVWPTVIVEECNLRAQIVTLRRVLGDVKDNSYIATVPGRGYRFVAAVTVQMEAQQAIPTLDQAALERSALPRLQHSVIGRDLLVETLGEQLQQCRFVTITGPGGIGKTTVALTLAKSLAAHFPQGMAFLDVASVSGTQLVNGTVSSIMGISPMTRSSGSSFDDNKRLLILDNCEHVLEESANAVETILRQAPKCCVLITSREPLHAEGEFVHDLAPLQVPSDDPDLCSRQALTYSSIQLFIERVTAHDPDFVFRDIDVHAAAAVCRKLDGNALAIEIAAARVRAFGMTHLVELLDGSFRLQMIGRRTAQPRHRTLSAMLDWTYSRLSDDERAMLRQLSVFTGAFTLGAVKTVVAINPGETQDSVSLLESLMNKSLLIAVASTSVKRYRLLQTTRLYASEKLAQYLEAPATAQRHAAYTLNAQRDAVKNLDSMSTDAWMAFYGPEVDSIRAALNWAYSLDGDQSLGVELTLMSVPLWLRLSLVDECHDWVNRGLQTGSHLDVIMPRQRMLLLTASASVMVLTHGAGQRIREAWKLVIEDARALGDTEHELRGLWGLWNDRCCSNQHREALDLATCYIQLSESSGSTDRRQLGKRMQAGPLFYMGDLLRAQQVIAESLSAALSPRTHIIDIHFDQRIGACTIKAQIQLLQGHVGQALLTIDRTVEEARAASHPVSLWYVLCLSAIPTSLLVDHRQRSHSFLKLLQNSVNGDDLYTWRLFARCFENILLIRDNNPEEGVPRLGEVLNQLHEVGDTPLYSLIRCEYAQGIAALGLSQQALNVLDETLLIGAARQERWFRPELLRVKAQLLIKQDDPTLLSLAHEILREAMAEAEVQGACFWTARITADLARLAVPLQMK
ncbi:ATP-binding protein [Pseudomonas sp. LB1P83]